MDAISAQLLAIAFPAIDPVAVQIGPVAIRWYALAYVGGLLLGWRYVRVVAAAKPAVMAPQQTDDLLTWVTLGVILGGRVGYVLFYKAGYYVGHPEQILMLWRGGMSFHGGLLGVTLAMWWFARRRGIPVLRLSDMVSCGIPIGLFLGRIANFINGELWGRVGEAPWVMVFPGAGPLPRHPSQLYEAALEGMVLFLGLMAVYRWTGARGRPGELTGLFCAGYAVSRIIVEFFREPDAHIGYLIGGTTMGQWLSLPLLAFGIYLVMRARRAAKAAGP